MAITTYSSMVNNMLAEVPGCPFTLFETKLRFAAHEFCRDGGVWLEDLTPIDTIALQDEYTLVSNVPSEGVVRTIKTIYYQTDPMKGRHIDTLRREHPDHPDVLNPGIPYKWAAVSRDRITLFPVPEDIVTAAVKVRCTIVPKRDGTGIDAEVAEDYEEQLLAGALWRLLSMPDKAWSDDKLAALHGKRFRSFIATARARIDMGFSEGSLSVNTPRVVPESVTFRRAV